MHTASVDYGAVVEEVQAELTRQMRGEKVAGAAIALIDGQQLVWAQGFGRANAEDDAALVGSHTPFPVGDLTQLVTTIAILQQVDAGRMSLDAPIAEYLPDLGLRSRFDAAPVPTLRQLLSHHGGLSNNIFSGSYQREAPDGLVAPGALYLAQPPGLIYAYSSLGFVLAGMALEAVTGERYAQYIESRILEPLGMSDAGFRPGPALARPHDKRGRAVEPVFARDQSALGLFASVRDLARLARWFLAADTQPVLPRAWVDEMARVQNAGVPLDLDNRVALPWQRTNTGRHNADEILRLYAFMPHHKGMMLLAPRQQVGVVILANSVNAGDLVLDIGRLALDAMLETKAGIARPGDVEDLPEAVGLPPSAVPDDLQTGYNTALGEIRFEGSNPKLDMSFLGREFHAELRDDGWYRIAFRLFGVIDVRFSVLAEILLRPVKIGTRQLLLVHFRGRDLLFGTALPEGEPWPDAPDWPGRYRLSNPGVFSDTLEVDELELELVGNRLYVVYELRNLVRLKPQVPALHLGAGRFYVPGLGTNMGEEFMLRRIDGQQMLVYSGWVFVRQ
ncbi:MAG: serine hydrolase domain-containing protein [Xanthomonadales bacterium]|nr:serine hydrolase domain-containing protein [Xanthomonadales bacterium]